MRAGLLRASVPFVVLMSLPALAACGSETTEAAGAGGSANEGGGSTSQGGAGGGGGDDCVFESVLGTDAAGETCLPLGCECFGVNCAAEGGTLRDDCVYATNHAYPIGHCYPPFEAPTATEFVCDGLFKCSVGGVCTIDDPIADGCTERACREPLAGCEADPSCACLVAAAEAQDRTITCEEDADGNATVLDDGLFWWNE